MKYQCVANPQHIFSHPAKMILNYPKQEPESIIPDSRHYPQKILEYSTCPECGCVQYSEFVEPDTPIEEPTNVYIYELATGPQTKLDELLAEGYKIVGRSVKLYQLEKSKVKPAPNDANPLTPDEQQIAVNQEYLAKKASV